MKTCNLKQSRKVEVARIKTARIECIAAFVIVFLLLLFTQNVFAETSSGMINRAPMEESTEIILEPTSLEKISSDLDNIIKSINEIPNEAQEEIVTTEPAKPAVKPGKPVPVIAKPEVKPETTEPKKVTKPDTTPPDKPVKKTVIVKKPEPVAPETAAPKTEIKQVMLKETPAVKPAHNIAYLKFSKTGAELEESTQTWACVGDTRNGLMWEVKDSNGGIRDKQHLYSWFDPSLKSGASDGGHCKGNISCDTNAYVKAMNKLKLCGHDDWRLPTKEEMQLLVTFDNNNSPARINSKYFPEAMPSWYWTASSNEGKPDYAWYILFNNGISLNDLKNRPKHIRLVRHHNKLYSSLQ